MELISCALSKDFFALHQPGPWRRTRHFGAKHVLLQAYENVLEPPSPPHSFLQEAPDRQIILIVSEATSGAALAGVTDLEAIPEVAQKKPL